MMTKYLLLKHYRGAPASVNDVPMDQWTPEELSAHVQYMQDFAARLEGKPACNHERLPAIMAGEPLATTPRERTRPDA
jgi:hypothetical protein